MSAVERVAEELRREPVTALEVDHVARSLRRIEDEACAEWVGGSPSPAQWPNLAEDVRDMYRQRAREFLRACGRPT